MKLQVAKLSASLAQHEEIFFPRSNLCALGDSCQKILPSTAAEVRVLWQPSPSASGAERVGVVSAC